jgi:hypothetical protein
MGASCKRQDKLRENQAVEITKVLIDGEIEIGREYNQELSLSRVGET